MMRGIVNGSNEATLPLRLRGPDGVIVDVTGVIDSGYSASLTLQQSVVDALGLVPSATVFIMLADGSGRDVPVYIADMEWDAAWILVPVYVVGEETLIGMRLLAGHDVRIAVVPGGAVEITPFP